MSKILVDRSVLEQALEAIGAFQRSEECEQLFLDATESLHGALAAPEPKYTTGHCEEHAKPGGCQRHNLHCGFSECDRRPIASTQKNEWYDEDPPC